MNLELVSYPVVKMNYSTFEVTQEEEFIKVAWLSETGTFRSFSVKKFEDMVYNLVEAGKDSINVMWDLDGQIAPILKMLGIDKCQQLSKENSTYFKPYTVFYIKSKVFTIRYVPGKVSVSFYDLSQYYPNGEPPQSLDSSHGRHRALLEAFQVLSLTPTKLTSPIAVWKHERLEQLDLPSSKDVPLQAAEFAWYCSGRLWVEAYKLGYFENATDYDISGAFPTIARDMLDLRKGAWKKSNRYQIDADYGYCYCDITINSKVSPILKADETGALYSPVGSWQDYLTKSEVEFVNNSGIGMVKVMYGWYFFSNEESYPLREEIDRILAFKKHHNTIVQTLAKKISVGMYGIFGEEWKDGFAPHSNMVYFAEISTRAKLEVARFIYENKVEDNLLHVSVDGILLDKEIK